MWLGEKGEAAQRVRRDRAATNLLDGRDGEVHRATATRLTRSALKRTRRMARG